MSLIYLGNDVCIKSVHYKFIRLRYNILSIQIITYLLVFVYKIKY